MIIEDLLKSIGELDGKVSVSLSPQELADHLDLLEKAHSGIHNLLINTRMKKLMNEFGERDTDVYVVSFPRSGTTVMQMILYQMTTDGSMDFDHIYDVSPWCRFSAFFNRPMPSVGERRIVKTHDPYEALEHVRNAKFIFLIRDCLDVMPSIYQQTLDYVDPTADFDSLSDRNMERWFEYNMAWLENRSGLEILYVHYEDLLRKKEEVVLDISEFLGMKIGEAVLERVLQRSAFDFMKKHESKFGEQPNHWKVYNNFIRSGRIGEGRSRFTDSQLKKFRQLSEKYRTKATTLQRYFD